MTTAGKLHILMLRLRFYLTGIWPKRPTKYNTIRRFSDLLRRVKSPRIRVASELAARRLVLATALAHARRDDEAAQFARVSAQAELKNALTGIAQTALATNTRPRVRAKREYRAQLRAARTQARHEAQLLSQAKRDQARADIMAERQETRARQMAEQEVLREETRARVAEERRQAREQARKKAMDAARRRAERRQQQRILLNPDLLLSPTQRKARRWQEHVSAEFTGAMAQLRQARPQTIVARTALGQEFLDELNQLRSFKGGAQSLSSSRIRSNEFDVFEDDMIDADTKALLESYEKQLNDDLAEMRAEAARRQKRQQEARRRVEERQRRQAEEDRLLEAARIIEPEESDVQEGADIPDIDLADANLSPTDAPDAAAKLEDDDSFLHAIESSLTIRLDQTAAPAPRPKPKPRVNKPGTNDLDIELTVGEFEEPDAPDFLANTDLASAGRRIRDELDSDADVFSDLPGQDDLLPELPAARRARPQPANQPAGPDRATLRLRRRVRLPATQPLLKQLITEELEQSNQTRVIELLEGAAIQERLDTASLRFWLNCALDAQAHEITTYLMLKGIAAAIGVGRWRRVAQLIWQVQSAEHPPSFSQLEPHFYQAETDLQQLATVILALGLGTPDQATKMLNQPHLAGAIAAHNLFPTLSSQTGRTIVLFLGDAKQHKMLELQLSQREAAPLSIISVEAVTGHAGLHPIAVDPAHNKVAEGLQRWLQETLFQLEADPAMNQLAQPFGAVATSLLDQAGANLADLHQQLTQQQPSNIIVWPHHHPRAHAVAKWAQHCCPDTPVTVEGLFNQGRTKPAHRQTPNHKSTALARESFDRFMKGLWRPLPQPDDSARSIYLCEQNEEPSQNRLSAITDPQLSPDYYEQVLDWRTQAPRRSDRAAMWLEYLLNSLPANLWAQLGAAGHIAWAAQLTPIMQSLLQLHLPRVAQLVARAELLPPLSILVGDEAGPFAIMAQQALGRHPSPTATQNPVRAYLNLRHNIDGKLAILVPDPRDDEARKLAQSLQRAIGDTADLQVAVQFLPNDPRHGRFSNEDTFMDLPVLHNLSMIDSLKAADFVVTPLSTTATSCALMGLNVLYVNDSSEIERDRQRVFDTVKVTKPRGLRVALRNMMAANS